MIDYNEIAYTFPEVSVLIDGEFQFFLKSEVEVDNLRLVVIRDGLGGRVEIVYHDKSHRIDATGAITPSPKFLDVSSRQFGQQIRLRRNDPLKGKLTVNSEEDYYPPTNVA